MADRIRRRLGYRFPRVGVSVAQAVLGRLPRRLDTELFSGIRVPLDLEQPLQAAAFWAGERSEQPTASILRGWLVGADRFFDMGANFGFFSYLAIDADPDVQVHCFEPIPALHSVHLEVRARNGLARLHPEAVGLSDVPASLPLRVLPAELGHSTFAPHPEHGDGDPVCQVQVVDFDTWCGRAGIALPSSPTWVAKLDVEGFEFRALEGMRRALAARAFRGIVVELNEFTLALCGSSIGAVRALLARHGYVDHPVPNTRGGINGFFVPRA